MAVTPCLQIVYLQPMYGSESLTQVLLMGSPARSALERIRIRIRNRNRIRIRIRYRIRIRIRNKIRIRS